MLDLGIAKLGVIGVVALIVLGPTRLPQVARTVGTIFGRAQRYLQSVRAEISQQLDLDALQDVQHSMYKATRTAQQTLRDTLYPPAPSPAWAQQDASDVSRRYASRSRHAGKRGYPPSLHRANTHLLPAPIHYKRCIYSQAARAKKGRNARTSTIIHMP